MHKLTDLGGFGPHIDTNAYTHVKNISHLTVLAAVDDMSIENGGSTGSSRYRRFCWCLK